MGDSDLSFEADWIRLYHIDFVVEGETLRTYTISEGKTMVNPINMPTPSKNSDEYYDYSFSHWDNLDLTYVPQSDMTVTAVFTKTVKISELDNGSYSVKINDSTAPFSSETIKDVVEKAKADSAVMLFVNLGDSIVTFNNAALKTLGNDASELAINKLDKDLMTPKMKDIIGDNVAYDITFGNNKTFGDGKVTVTVPYQLDAGMDADNLIIYYIVDGIVSEKIPCHYNDGNVTFVTDHFSTYAVMYINPESEQEFSNDPEYKQEFPIAYAAVGGLAILVLAGGAIVVKKRKS